MSIKIISRGKGKSAVAAATYRAAECIKSEYDGRINDYTKKGGVIHTEILLPEHAPKEYANRAVLWNAVEKSERYKTAQLAREIEVALPKELTQEQNLFLVRDYIKRNFVNQEMCADFAIHDKGDGNPHCHILLTMRAFEPSGEWAAKSTKINGRKVSTTDWDNRANAEEWRKDWANSVNAVLARENIGEKIDHRSFKRQGKDELPTVHLGVAASQMEQKGIRTERGNRNQEIAVTNSHLRQLKARIVKLENWIKEETANPAPPTLYDVIQDVLSRQAKSGKSQHYQNINNVKKAAEMLMFLQNNKITDIADLEDKVKSMRGKQSDIREKLKPVERRLKTLDEHIKQAEIYKKHRATARHYEDLYSKYTAAKNSTGFGAKRKAEKSLEFAGNYYRSNESEMILFEAAERYFKEVLQKRFDPKKLPPITKWKAERDSLNAERESLYRAYYSLKDEVKEVEQIKRGIDEVMRSDRGQTRKQEYGLE